MAQTENKQLEELLPWYVNGSLAKEEEASVRQYVQDNADAARDVEILRHVYDAARSEEYGSPGEFGRRRLRAALEDETRSHSGRESASRWWKPALAAAALVIVVQGGFLLDVWRQTDSYQPAGVSPDAPTIQLQFAPEATEQQIRTLLNELGVEIVSGPGSVGVYRIVPISDDADTTGIVERLRASDDIVTFVEAE